MISILCCVICIIADPRNPCCRRMSWFQDVMNTCQAEKFDRYASNQLVIYRVCEGLSTLTAGFSRVIGYKLRG